jgi:hypothetical protein
MFDSFSENSYREVGNINKAVSGNVLKKTTIHEVGNFRVEVHDEQDDGVKILLNKDENGEVKEIKFVCSCGETKVVVLDYNEQ